MFVTSRTCTRSLLTAAAGLCALTAAAVAQPALATEYAGLRCDLRALRPVFWPEAPIRLRFSLINTSDQPVVVPLDPPLSVAEGITLPIQIIFGGSPHAILVSYENEEPREILPPAVPPPSGDAVSSLRLAPGGALGAEIDLASYFPAARYTGSYRVEWRPLEGKIGAATAEFRVESRRDAILVTDLGKITFVLEYDRAPANVENFLELVRDGFYNGKTLHRVIPGFILQGGCPKGDGTGIRPDGKLIPAEFSDLEVDAGTLLMARKPSDPNSASCQFFIALSRLRELDGQYTVIGQARDPESQRTLQALAAVPTDNRDRPRSPLTIRSINLVDHDRMASRAIELRRSTTFTPTESPCPPTETRTSAHPPPQP